MSEREEIRVTADQLRSALESLFGRPSADDEPLDLDLSTRALAADTRIDRAFRGELDGLEFAVRVRGADDGSVDIWVSSHALELEGQKLRLELGEIAHRELVLRAVDGEQVGAHVRIPPEDRAEFPESTQPRLVPQGG